MKVVNKILFVLFVCIVISCNNNNQTNLYSISGNTMGTTYSIKLVTPSETDGDEIQLLKSQVDSLLRKINIEMSTYIDTSEISKLNNAKDTNWIEVSDDFALVTKQALRICKLSEGALDITISPFVNIWGFGPTKKPTIIPSQKEIDEVKKLVNYKNLIVKEDFTAIKKKDPNLKITLSTIAKGFGVDKVANFLAVKGFANFLVEIGGEVRVHGEKPNKEKWKVGISTPDGKMGIQKIVELDSYSMATSGDYYNYFEENGMRYSHIIDPKTGKPIKHKMVSVTVLNRSCSLADAMATAIFVMGPQKGFNFAVKNKIPIFMIIKNKNQFVEKTTKEFEKLISKLEKRK